MSAFKPPKASSSLKIEQLRRAIVELRNLCMDLNRRMAVLEQAPILQGSPKQIETIGYCDARESMPPTTLYTP